MDYLHDVDLSTSTATDKNEKYKRYEWWQNNKLHRLDGPAINAEKLQIYQWWINGVNKTNKIIKWLEDNEIDWRNMSNEEKVLLKEEFNND